MENKKNDLSLKDDFLAACQSNIFSQTPDNELQVERRRLALKYLTAKKYESEDVASLLLREGLKRYSDVRDETGFLEKIKVPENKTRSERRTKLHDVEQALSFVKPLQCQRKSSDKICGRRELVDRDVENFFNLFDEAEESVTRKIPTVQQKITDCSRFKFNASAPGTSYQNDSSRRQKINHDSGEEEKRPYFRSDAKQRKQRGNDLDANEDNEYSRKDEETSKTGLFRSAKTELHIQQRLKQKKSLGGKAPVNSKFVCPLKREKDREDEKKFENTPKNEEPEDERLRGIDEKLIELVRNEIMDSGTCVNWEDVAGLENAKKIIKEIIVYPMLRPDIFTGLRRPPKGMLLFGPPGTGKTLIGKCIASQSKSTFFSISASSLTSKWIGEGEKMVRALFAVARVHQPSVIFMDEIDSLLTQRSETEHESSRRIKTEFLVQLDGAATGAEDRILVIGATNRPQELDEAARRRFVKRLYVPLPEFDARKKIIENLLTSESHELNSRDIDNIANLTEHYSGADMSELCKEASMGPIRSIPFENIENIRKEDVRGVTARDFNEALANVKPSVSQEALGQYVVWDRTYGSG